MDSSGKTVHCGNCWKPYPLCLCGEFHTIKNEITVLILQHPRESRRSEGTARLVSLILENSVHRVGLSWGSLSAALGERTDPKQWGVLYLGGLKESKAFPKRGTHLVDRPRGEGSKTRGIVVLDGTWKESKTLWWRNPWLMKLRRLIISPSVPSAYSPVRKQPRKTSLSSIEAVSQCLMDLKESDLAVSELNSCFSKFLKRARNKGDNAIAND